MDGRKAQRRAHATQWDSGLASERTALAWQRTATAAIALATLVLRAGIVERQVALSSAIATLLVVTAASAWLASRALGARVEPPPAVRHRAMLAIGVVTPVVAVGSAALAAAS